MRIALAQLNPTVGDLTGNVDRMTRASREAAVRGAEAVVFPELSITGYPPRDLVEKPSFLESSERELERLARETADLDLSVICGYVARSQAETGKRALNSAALIEHGAVVFRQSKMLLPNYDVFDEARYFRPAERELLCTVRGAPVALTICEDAWNDRRFWKERLYQRDPVEELFGVGAEMMICINASPYNMGKRAMRANIYRAAARRYNKPVIYVNQVGGND
ncbi:MAG TPA: nitrilase-related carbon-nitrogen hydrolase, partial [Bryobacteraceae bacterium]|nr:nitrilase-related carbon-nitrogen hydrolase [Bryobacteraceae bacterium]